MFRVQMCLSLESCVGPLSDPKGHGEPRSCDEQKCVVMFFKGVRSKETEADREPWGATSQSRGGDQCKGM